jgi:hypothetical protein
MNMSFPNLPPCHDSMCHGPFNSNSRASYPTEGAGTKKTPLVAGIKRIAFILSKSGERNARVCELGPSPLPMRGKKPRKTFCLPVLRGCRKRSQACAYRVPTDTSRVPGAELCKPFPDGLKGFADMERKADGCGGLTRRKTEGGYQMRIVGRRMKASEQGGAISNDGLAPGGRFRSGT